MDMTIPAQTINSPFEVIVVYHSKLENGIAGYADFYVNGQYQGKSTTSSGFSKTYYSNTIDPGILKIGTDPDGYHSLLGSVSLLEIYNSSFAICQLSVCTSTTTSWTTSSTLSLTGTLAL